MRASLGTLDGYERVSDADIAAAELRAATFADGTAICLGNADGDLFAVQNACTHAAFALSDGTLLAGGVIECAWHGARFDCRTGVALQEPASDPLTRYDVRVAHGGVWVRKPL